MNIKREIKQELSVRRVEEYIDVEIFKTTDDMEFKNEDLAVNHQRIINKEIEFLKLFDNECSSMYLLKISTDDKIDKKYEDFINQQIYETIFKDSIDNLGKYDVRLQNGWIENGLYFIDYKVYCTYNYESSYDFSIEITLIPYEDFKNEILKYIQ